jgi:hypothetical protein
MPACRSHDTHTSCRHPRPLLLGPRGDRGFTALPPQRLAAVGHP